MAFGGEVRTQWERFYSPATQAALPNFARNDHTPLVTLLTAVGFTNLRVEVLTAIRAAEATPVGHQACDGLVADRPT